VDLAEILDLIYGTAILIVLGMVALFVISFLIGFFGAWKEAVAIVQARKEASENITLHLDVIDQTGSELFLLYEHPTYAFSFQANSSEEVAKIILEKYKNKRVLLKQNGEERVIDTFTKA
jgi:hypothetical protein